MPGVESVGRLLLIAGAGLVVVGLILILAGRLGFPLGRLPGDITFRRDHVTVYAPLISCLVLSVVLTVLLNLILLLLRR